MAAQHCIHMLVIFHVCLYSLYVQSVSTLQYIHQTMTQHCRPPLPQHQCFPLVCALAYSHISGHKQD